MFSRWSFVVGLVLILSACGGTSEPPRDASARIACRDFQRALIDAQSGVLTTPEFRARVQRVHENARLVDPAIAPGVRDAATDLLKATTSGTTDEGATATKALIAACQRPGALGTEW